jgi:sulfite exporter TauE/SafE
MNLWQGLTQGFLLGLSLAPTCFGVCFPLLVPYFSSEQRDASANARALWRFLSGRFLGYIFIGALAGWLGQVWMLSVQNTRRLEGVGFVGVGAVLLVFGTVKSFPHWSVCRFLETKAGLQRIPLWLGLFTGLNICPPFVAALFEAGRAGGLVGGVVVFVGFFTGTSLILLPVALAGSMAKLEALRMAGRIAAIIMGIWFILQGVRALI